MTTELWFRNPPPYVPQLKQVVTKANVVWDIAYLRHNNIDPFMFMHMEFGYSDWQYIIVYQEERYATLFDKKRVAVAEFPLWHASEDSIDDLIDFLEHGDEDEDDEDRRVFITGFDLYRKKSQLFEIAELVKSYPDVKVHYFNSYSFVAIFGLGFTSGDYAPREEAAKGNIMLPSGKVVLNSGIEEAKFWVESLGFNIAELKTDRNARIRFNIVSATWAAQHFNKLPEFKSKIRYIPIDSTVGKEVLKNTAPLRRRSLSIIDTDKKACDFCSLWNDCRYFREGSVCTLPGSDYNEIAENLGTRNAFQIADGIGKLLQLNVERISDARTVEKARNTSALHSVVSGDEDDDEDETRRRPKSKYQSQIDPELTKLIDSTIKHGVALANLYQKPDPEKNGKVVVVINGTEGGGAAQLNASPAVTRELASRAVAELESSGVARDDITEAHIEKWLADNIIEGETE